jgi:hypothetical protein
VTVAARADVVSSFTIIKGTMIEETYAVFGRWDFELSKKDNLDRLRAENYIGASSTTWLRDVTKVLNRRYEPASRDRALVILAQGHSSLTDWSPLLLWHMTRDEFLLRDFLSNWLFPLYEGGAYRVRLEELDGYVHDIRKRGGVIEHEWSDATEQRVATGLLRAAADFDLLKGTAAKEFRSYHLPDGSFLYLLHALRDQGLSPQKMIASPDWRMFLMRPSDVERELLRLHQFRKLHYEVAGSIVELSLPHKSALEFAEAMVA